MPAHDCSDLPPFVAVRRLFLGNEKENGEGHSMPASGASTLTSRRATTICRLSRDDRRVG